MFNPGCTHTALIQAGVISLLTAFLTVEGAVADEVERGWRYPYSCSTDSDCRAVSNNAVSERLEGYVIEITGELLPYTDKRVRNSPDAAFHWCSVADRDDTRTVCLLVPPRNF